MILGNYLGYLTELAGNSPWIWSWDF